MPRNNSGLMSAPMTGHHRRGFAGVLLGAMLAAVTLTAGPAAAAPDDAERGQPWAPTQPAEGGLIDLPMYRDPILDDRERVIDFHPRLKTLWLEAMDRPSAMLRGEAALAFARAHVEGMPNLDDVPDRLVRLLKEDESALVRQAAAEALVVFDYAPAAAAMLEQSGKEQGNDMVLVVDSALAAWAYEPARAVWLKRLASPDATLTTRISAVQSLGAVAAAEAVAPLHAIVMNTAEPVTYRLEAARALGLAAREGLNDAAGELASQEMIDRLVAASMLRSHSDERAIALLRELTGDASPAVAAAAVQSLTAIDPAQVAQLADDLLGHADPSVRRATVRAVVQVVEPASPPRLGRALNDTDVNARHLARQTLVDWAANAHLTEPVRQTLRQALDGEDWRGLEQAALAMGQLDEEATADRMLELLNFDRAEVRLAAAQALRQLEVSATLPTVLTHAERLVQLGTGGESRPDEPERSGSSLQNDLTQLLLLMGELRYAPADPLMRTLIPKDVPFTPDARGAAIWGLGRIHESDASDSGLVGQLTSRLSDINPMAPEANTVRQFSAISLGRMKAQQSLGVLQRFYEMPDAASINGSCRWAIMHITGKPLPPLEPSIVTSSDWFLEPID